jgi:hypothetical protein
LFLETILGLHITDGVGESTLDGKKEMGTVRVSLFRFKKKMRNEAKQSEKDAKTNSKLARGSETKRNKVRMPQFCLHEPLKTILTHKETCKKFASFACFFMV